MKITNISKGPRARMVHLEVSVGATAVARYPADGVIVIKAQRYRTQEQNRADALERLVELIRQAAVVEKKRRPTKPTRASQRRRLDGKARRGAIKAGRGRVDY